MLTAIVVENDRVIVRAERFGRKVRRHERYALPRALLHREFGNPLAFGGEADAERRLRQRRHPRQDIGVFLELEGHSAITFLHLVRRAVLYAVVSHRSNRDEYV